jgi:hypothetical protein
MPTLGRIHTDIFKSFSGFGRRIRMVKKRSHALPHPIRQMPPNKKVVQVVFKSQDASSFKAEVTIT